MKTSKKLILAVICIIAAVCTFAFAACDPEEIDDSVDSALLLAEKSDTISVVLTKDNVVYYSFEKSGESDPVISNPYGVNVDYAQYIDFAKEIKTSVSSSDITITEKNYSESNGAIGIAATFNDTEKTLGISVENATLAIDGNLTTGVLNSYKVAYTDTNGYNVEITLS